MHTRADEGSAKGSDGHVGEQRRERTGSVELYLSRRYEWRATIDVDDLRGTSGRQGSGSRCTRRESALQAALALIGARTLAGRRDEAVHLACPARARVHPGRGFDSRPHQNAKGPTRGLWRSGGGGVCQAPRRCLLYALVDLRIASRVASSEVTARRCGESACRSLHRRAPRLKSSRAYHRPSP